MSPRHIEHAALEAREEELLDQALKIISEQGATALTMDKLVASVNYSKGTVYKHFSSKEDVFAGLCNRNMRWILTLFLRVSAIDACARERMTAIGFAYMLATLLAPQNFLLVMHAKTALFEKASEARREEHTKIDEQLFGVIIGIIGDAIEQQELTPSESIDEKKISFSLWSMTFGTIGLLLNGDAACSHSSGLTMEDRVLQHGNIVMDGIGWAPSKRKTTELVTWLKTDIFKEEVKALKKSGIDLMPNV